MITKRFDKLTKSLNTTGFQHALEELFFSENTLYIDINCIKLAKDGDLGTLGKGELIFNLIINGQNYNLGGLIHTQEAPLTPNIQFYASVRKTKFPITFDVVELDGAAEMDGPKNNSTNNSFNYASATINVDIEKDFGKSNWVIIVDADGIKATIEFSMWVYPSPIPGMPTAYTDVDGRGIPKNLMKNLSYKDEIGMHYDLNWADLKNSIGNDTISSIYIPPTPPIYPKYMIPELLFQDSIYSVEVFEHANFEGRSKIFTSWYGGAMRMVNLKTIPGWDNVISSIRVIFNHEGIIGALCSK